MSLIFLSMIFVLSVGKETQDLRQKLQLKTNRLVVDSKLGHNNGAFSRKMTNLAGDGDLTAEECKNLGGTEIGGQCKCTGATPIRNIKKDGCLIPSECYNLKGVGEDGECKCKAQDYDTISIDGEYCFFATNCAVSKGETDNNDSKCKCTAKDSKSGVALDTISVNRKTCISSSDCSGGEKGVLEGDHCKCTAPGFEYASPVPGYCVSKEKCKKMNGVPIGDQCKNFGLSYSTSSESCQCGSGLHFRPGRTKCRDYNRCASTRRFDSGNGCDCKPGFIMDFNGDDCITSSECTSRGGKPTSEACECDLTKKILGVEGYDCIDQTTCEQGTGTRVNYPKRQCECDRITHYTNLIADGCITENDCDLLEAEIHNNDRCECKNGYIVDLRGEKCILLKECKDEGYELGYEPTRCICGGERRWDGTECAWEGTKTEQETSSDMGSLGYSSVARFFILICILVASFA